MDNDKAYNFLKENDSENLSSLTRKFMAQCSVQDEFLDHYQPKFVALLREREVCRKKALEAWKLGIFGPSIAHTCTVTATSSDLGEKSSSQLKPLLECSLKHQRNRTSSLLDCFRDYAEIEKISAKQAAALLLQLTSNDEKDYTVSNFCK